MPEGIITIRKDREKPIRNQHPWIFSGAIQSAANAENGSIVTIVDHQGEFLARGYWNSKSQIQVRILTWENEAIDEKWWKKSLLRAISSRKQAQNPKNPETLAYRLVNAENDFIPGLIIDRYGDWLVLQALTLHIDQQKHTIAKHLSELLPIKGVYERSDVDVRGKEGLSEQIGLLWGEEPPEFVTIYEPPFQFLVDIRHGHKTGTYLDQTENRHILLDIAQDIRQQANNTETKQIQMLNLFSYTGGFTPAVASQGNSVTLHVDASSTALQIAEKNYHLNQFNEEELHNHAEFIQADVFDYLRDAIQRGEQYDIVILDPPKFAQSKRKVEKAARGYKDINLNALKVIKPGGYLMTFSCSGAINRDLFQKIVFGALADSGRQAQIIRHLGSSADHPVALTFPEGEYLKGLLLRVY